MKKTILVILLLVAITCTFTSCTDATRAKFGGYGDDFKVELVNCDGTITHTWISSGKVASEANSDGYFFKEKSTGILVEVTGTLIITKLK